VAVLLEEPFEEEGQALALGLNLPVIRLNDTEVLSSEAMTILDNIRHILRLVPFEIQGRDPTFALSIEAQDEMDNNEQRRRNSWKFSKQKPSFIDLCPSESSRTGKRGSREGGSDLLIKAVGPGKQKTTQSIDGRKGMVIYDLTAGLGQDSLVMALNGAHEVHMVEKDPIVAALLTDAMRRLNLLSTLQGLDSRAEQAIEMSRKLHLHCGEGTEVLKDLLSSGTHPPPDVVYLDPMFPPRKKTAKVKKEMKILHSLLDTQNSGKVATVEEKRLHDELHLLEESMMAATRKVVVKRPSNATPLGGHLSPFRVSYVIEGSVNRWDVYVVK